MDDDPAPPGPPGAGVPPLIGSEIWGARELCRVPSAGGPAWEAALAAANHCASERSFAVLREDLSSLDDMLAAEWGGPAVATDVSTGLLERLGAAALADDLLAFHDLPPDRLRAHGPDGVLDPQSALAVENPGYGIRRPGTPALTELLRGGGAASVLGVEEHSPRFSRWMEHLDRVFGQTCRADLIFSGPREGWIGPADDAGRLFVPVEGEGRLEARPASDGAGGMRLPSSHALEAGRSSYLPAGCGHRVVGTTASITVLVIVLPRLSVRDLLVAAGSDAVFWPLLRADLPVDRSAPALSYAGSVVDPEHGLGAATMAALDDAALGRTLARNRARMGARWSASLTGSLAAITEPGESIRLRCPIPGGLQAGPDQPDGSVGLYGGGHKLRTSPEVATALARLADGDTHESSELEELAPAGDATWSLRLAQEVLALPIGEVAP